MASGGSGVKGDALGSYGTATGQADNAFGIAAPIYGQMARKPQGYMPQEMADRITASNQTLGGSNAAAVGEGALASARTNNAGGYQAAIDDAARTSGATQSENVLGVMNQSDALKRQQQEEGLSGLSNIYGTASKTGMGYLDLANQAKPTFWQNLGTAAAKGALTAASSLA
jgi:hypothetical protein